MTIEFLVSPYCLSENYVNAIREASNLSQDPGVFSSRWQPFLVAVDLYTALFFTTIQAIVVGVVTRPLTTLLRGNVSQAAEEFGMALLDVIHKIKRIIVLPFFFIAAIFFPQTIYGKLNEAFPLDDEVSETLSSKSSITTLLDWKLHKETNEPSREADHYAIMAYSLTGNKVSYPITYIGYNANYPERLRLPLSIMQEFPGWPQFLREIPYYIENVPSIDPNLDREGAYKDCGILCPIATGMAGVPRFMSPGANTVEISIILRTDGELYEVLVSDHRCFPETGRGFLSIDTSNLPLVEWELEGKLADDMNNTDHAWYERQVKVYICQNNEDANLDIRGFTWQNVNNRRLDDRHSAISARFLGCYEDSTFDDEDVSDFRSLESTPREPTTQI